jgi:hypothetical protein
MHLKNQKSVFFSIFLFEGRESNFRKHSSGIDSQGTTYDYGSVMHYGGRAFSKNGQPTIVSKKPGVSI